MKYFRLIGLIGLLSSSITMSYSSGKIDVIRWIESPTDLNGDGVINALDIFIVAQQFNADADLFMQPTPTPDPRQANLPAVGEVQEHTLENDFPVTLDYPTGREAYVVIMRNPSIENSSQVSILDNQQLDSGFITQASTHNTSALVHEYNCCIIPEIHTLPTQREVEPAQFQTLNVGQQRSFDLFGGSTVNASLRYLGTHAAIFVDDDVWMQGESTVGQELVDREGIFFDETTYPVITSTFGVPGDVNKDGHIAILFTKKASIADGAGFFFGGDLFRRSELDPSNPTNTMELLYIVPPGTSPVAVDEEDIAPNIAHELQHLINFYNHSLIFGGRNGLSDEERWLDEGMSHLAEDFVANGRSNRNRRSQYLERTATQGLFVDGFFPTAVQRGGAYLLCRYLTDRFGEQIISKLVQTNEMGFTNIARAAGISIENILRDWSRTLFVSNLGVTDDPAYNYTFFAAQSTLDIRDWGRPFFNDHDLSNLQFFGRLYDSPLAPGGFGYTVMRATIPGMYGITLSRDFGPNADVDIIRLPDQFVFPNVIAEDFWEGIILDEPLSDLFTIGEPRTITGRSVDGQPLSRFRVTLRRGSDPFAAQKRIEGEVDGDRFSVTVLFDNENEASTWTLFMFPNDKTSSRIQPVQVVAP